MIFDHKENFNLHTSFFLIEIRETFSGKVVQNLLNVDISVHKLVSI